MVLQILQQEQDVAVNPSWEQVRLAIRILSIASVNNAEQILHLFSVRHHAEGYVPGDERVYDMAMKQCEVLGRWMETIDLLRELIKERTRPSSFIFETVAKQLASQIASSTASQASMLVEQSLADVYHLMVRLKVVPTPRTESLLAKYLPKEMRQYFQRDLARSELAKQQR
jgi:hypothetical protein